MCVCLSVFIYLFICLCSRLCDDIDITNKKDVMNLYSMLAGNFEDVVQYNKDNRGFEVNQSYNSSTGLTCTFRESCYSTHLSWAHTTVSSWAVCIGQMVSS